jgi:glycosyltransferase involved in cell wall biosynthesis
MLEKVETSNPLRVGILHYACYPVVGGVESIMTTHARLLRAEGHEPFIIAGRGDPAGAGLEGIIIPELDSRHPDILKVQTALLNGEEWAPEAFERWVERIASLLSDALDNPDVCIAHNAFTLHKNLPLTAALARLAQQGRGAKRWIAWCHDLAWNNPLYTGDLREGWPWEALKMCLPNVTYVAVSEQRRQEMASLFGQPVANFNLVPNGIDSVAFIPSSPELTALREWLQWDSREWIFLAPVRITRRKNLELAIRIMGALRDLGRDPLLVITGPPGPHNVRSDAYLRELTDLRAALGLEREVTFLALEGQSSGTLNVSDDLMNELYWWADALLITSEQEGFGLPLLEAGLARLPIFCSDLEVLREVGGDHATYFGLDEPPAQIAALISHAMQATGVVAMRRRVMTQYTWDVIFKSQMLPLLM